MENVNCRLICLELGYPRNVLIVGEEWENSFTTKYSYTTNLFLFYITRLAEYLEAQRRIFNFNSKQAGVK